MIYIIYALIILGATISGAIAGLGGGVIIRPLFDLIGYHEVAAIAFYSSVAVFTMASVSVIKQISKGFKFNWKIIITISLGSLLGGVMGQQILRVITSEINNSLVVVVQGFMLLGILTLVLAYKLNKHKIRHFQITNLGITFLVGIILGTTAVFLGIGGGPLNMLVFLLLFSYPTKQATVYSIATIFFAQGANLVTIVATRRINNFDLSFIPLIIIVAIMGGFIGTKINRLLDDKKIDKFFSILMAVLILITLYNIISNMI